MRLINRFLMHFSTDQDENIEVESKTNILFANVVNFFLFVIVFSEGIVSLLEEDLFFAGPLLLFSILYATNYLVMGRSGKSTTYYKEILFAFVSITFIFFIVFSGTSGINIIWVGIFPFIVINLFGRKKGAYHSLFILAFMILDFTLFSKIIPNATQYSINLMVLFSIYFCFAFIIAYTLKFIYAEVMLSKEQDVINTQNSKNSKDEQISNLSRQIRTPLSNITGILDILDKTELTEDQRDYINTIHASANNLVSVVTNLVTDSSVNINPIPEEKISFNLYSTLTNTIRIFSNNNAKQKFSLSFSADIPNSLIGNSIKTKQIFLNILNSIAKYNISEDQTLKIEVAKTNSMPGDINLMFKIITHGHIPFPKEFSSNGLIQEQEIFRLNSTKYIQFLELELTKKLIEQDGHTLIITPKVDETCIEFGITFKENKYSSSVLQIKKRLDTDTKLYKEPIEMKDATLLLVEDNISNQQIILLYLKNMVKKIEVANNGKEALNKFGNAKFDVILMDVQMPIMDGLKATRKIREIEQSTNSHTPIIAITANAFPEDKQRCLDAGMDDYMSKPFQPDTLIEKIKSKLSNN
ncbi:response regulator [Saccharicrinis aurantiacus]|uniref:response regulator n=1 Tax=Saccharicrinis aurantiacus TaxID=1849719 RepID=UPI0008389E99|nr:response regulator [Saccharicrinis aurantiacus]